MKYLRHTMYTRGGEFVYLVQTVVDVCAYPIVCNMMLTTEHLKNQFNYFDVLYDKDGFFLSSTEPHTLDIISNRNF